MALALIAMGCPATDSGRLAERQNEKELGFWWRAPPGGTNFLLLLYSPELEGKQLLSFPIKLKGCVCPIDKECLRAIHGFLLKPCGRKPDWVSCPSGTQIHLFWWKSSWIQTFGLSWKQSETHLSPWGWYGCLRFSQFCGIVPFLCTIVFWESGD